MKITLFCVGKLKEGYLREGVAEYVKRLSAYCKLEIIEIPDSPAPENPSASEIERVKRDEAERISKRLPKDAHTIALAIDGKAYDSEGFARFVGAKNDMGQATAFIIGGSWGIDENLLAKCEKISFSALTFPHQLMRLIFVEQLYRAFKIIGNENYHK